MSRMNKKELVGDTPHVRSRLLKENSVKIEQDDGTVIMRYYKTDVITVKPNGDMVLNTDGNRTHTTKRRMNNWQDKIHVWQQHGVWYVAFNNNQSITYEYQDGMTIHANNLVGYPTN